MRRSCATESRQALLDHLDGLVRYWAGERGSNVPVSFASRQRLEGLVHSILCMLDGCSGGMPAFDLVPRFAGDDPDDAYEPFRRDVPVEGGGGLHDTWSGMRKHDR